MREPVKQDLTWVSGCSSAHIKDQVAFVRRWIRIFILQIPGRMCFFDKYSSFGHWTVCFLMLWKEQIYRIFSVQDWQWN